MEAVWDVYCLQCAGHFTAVFSFGLWNESAVVWRGFGRAGFSDVSLFFAVGANDCLDAFGVAAAFGWGAELAFVLLGKALSVFFLKMRV